MSDVLRTDRAPAEVFALLTEPDRLAAWHHAFDHAERVDAGPFAVGSRFRAESRVDGRPAVLDVEVVGLDAPHRLELEGRSDDVRSHAVVTVEPVEGGSEVTATSHGRIDDEGDDRAVEPAANPAFADLAGSLLAGLRVALEDDPVEPR